MWKGFNFVLVAEPQLSSYWCKSFWAIITTSFMQIWTPMNIFLSKGVNPAEHFTGFLSCKLLIDVFIVNMFGRNSHFCFSVPIFFHFSLTQIWHDIYELESFHSYPPLFQIGLDVPANQVELIQDVWGKANLTTVLDFDFDFSELPPEARIRTKKEIGRDLANQSCAGFQIRVRRWIFFF